MYPDIQILEYVELGDFFVETKEYKSISERLGLTEWNSVVWIGRLLILDNDYGEHWFDNWEARESKEELANELGYEMEDLLIVDPQKFQDGKDGPCHTDEFRKKFWTDVLRNLRINLSTIIEKAIEENENRKERESQDFDRELENKIKELLEEYGVKKSKIEEELVQENERKKESASNFTKKQIKEIVEDLEVGMKCYINKETNDVKITIDFDSEYVDIENWEEDKNELEMNWRKYYEIEPMPSREGFMVMEEFIDKVNEKNLKEQLIRALNKRKPFQNFKYEVENSNYREQWFKYRMKNILTG